MESDTVKQLLELNSQFYQTFAASFSATRRRIQPGVRRIIERIPPGARLLDLGCGNGELWRVLSEDNRVSHYTGLDFSPPLLEFAGEGGGKGARRAPLLSDKGANPSHFVQADLAEPDWAGRFAGQSFDLIFAFAVLHHLPGAALRRQVLEQARLLLAPGGAFYHSEWQFLNSPRLQARLQPWERIGLSAAQVEANDYLLDWRHGGEGLRYVHHFDLAELEQLAQESGFSIAESFFSDGEGGKLSVYQRWQVA